MTDAPIHRPRTRPMTIVAQDPAVVDTHGRILTAIVDVPAEALAPGPRGYRVHVIDYDGSTRTLYKPARFPPRAGSLVDPFPKPSRRTILGAPAFHAQNVYAIVMRTLARFEFALGRRVGWGFDGHQIKVAPHAFADANAFYSERDESLLFGYFPGRRGNVFTCLSHDIVAHETTHALLDGLRERYTDPSSPDQAAFHEAFADVVALLSVFSIPAVVRTVIDRRTAGDPLPVKTVLGRPVVHVAALAERALQESLLLGLAKQMGQELSAVRGQPLRQSARLVASKRYLDDPEYLEPHRRGEILVAAILQAFIDVLRRRLTSLGRVSGDYVDRDRVAEEAAAIADYLLTMAIRALDYAPPVHIEFADFLVAMLTADREIRPDDSKYRFRAALLASFKRFGIEPPVDAAGPEPGVRRPVTGEFLYEQTHFESMSRDRHEMFRFVWENRTRLGLKDAAYIRVLSVRPCLRIAPDDGFALRETVAECLQQIGLQAHELPKLGVRKPDGMPDDTEIMLAGGVTLVFDEYGRLKFAIPKPIVERDASGRDRRLEYLWAYGHFRKGASITRRFAAMHWRRSSGARRAAREEW